MTALEADLRVEGVEAEINYLSADSAINRRFVAPGAEVNTGRYEPHRVRIGDARRAGRTFTLDDCGFTLAHAPSRVADFLDKNAVEAAYPDEVVETVRRLTGASLVAPMGWMVRSAGDLSAFARESKGYTHRGGVQPPAGDAHVDMLPDRAEGLAKTLYARLAPDGPGYSRFIATSFWRAFSPPPQDFPLAVCDGRSVGEDEGVANTMIVVDALPDRETMYAPRADEAALPAAAVFRYRPGHRWWYFPEMTRDEAILLKFYDSDRSTAWRAPHTAFHDPSFPDAGTRQSIEFRTVAFFE